MLKNVDSGIAPAFAPLTGYKPLADAPLDEITSEMVSDFAAHRLRDGMQVSSKQFPSRAAAHFQSGRRVGSAETAPEDQDACRANVAASELLRPKRRPLSRRRP